MARDAKASGVRADWNVKLEANYLGTYNLPLKNVNINGRLLADSGRAKIKASMDISGGFLKHHTPLVVIESHDEPSGQLLSSDALAGAPVRILDGAYRTNALRKKYGGDAKFAFRLYRDFGGVTHTIIASAAPQATGELILSIAVGKLRGSDTSWFINTAQLVLVSTTLCRDARVFPVAKATVTHRGILDPLLRSTLGDEIYQGPTYDRELVDLLTKLKPSTAIAITWSACTSAPSF